MPQNTNTATNFTTEWKLETYLYTGFDDPQLKSDLEEVQRLTADIEKRFKGILSKGEVKTLVEYFELDGRLSYLTDKIYIYHYLLKSKYNKDTKIQKHYAEVEAKFTDIQNQLAFTSQEFKAIGYERLLELAKDQSLEPHANYLVQTAHNIQYLLSEEAEKVANIKDFAGFSVVNTLRSKFTSAFKFEITIDGKTETKTEEEVRSLRMDPREKVRKAAFESLYKVYNDPQVQTVLGSLYKSVIRNSTGMIKLRGLKGVMSSRNISEEQEDEVVDLLLKVVKDNYSLIHRYLKLKARAVGKDKLNYYDRFAPITQNKKEIPYDYAANLFLETIAGFDQEFADYSRDLLTGGRIDVYPREGKIGGAYANYSKGVPSTVFLNYTGTMNDVTTLAHELGHATHGYFSQDQEHTVYDTGFSLAETASVFNETLFSESFIQTLDNPKDKVAFLEEQISAIFSTIFRQIMYTLFEKQVHQSIFEGKDLDAREFTEIWTKCEAELYGGNLVYPDNYVSPVWAMIPHFFRPFYCYSYAFGNILSFSLYQKYKQQGQAFVDDYKDILRSGGSLPPKDLLAKYDIDITKPEFFEGGLKVLEGMLDQFEESIQEIT
jgi:oligoendopeptidase F